MEGEKKVKRPRISETRSATREGFAENTESKEYDHSNVESGTTENQSSTYNKERSSYNNERRSYNNNRGYNNSRGYSNGGYNNRSYNNGSYNNRGSYNSNRGYNNGYNSRSYNNNAEGENNENSQSYNSQENSYNNERRSYNNNRGGYNNRYSNNRGYNNGYNNRGGYNSNRGYNNGYNSRSYNNNAEGENNENSQNYNNQENGYNSERRSYNNNRGGYNNRYSNNRGYSNGGYNNRGGYNSNNRGYNSNRGGNNNRNNQQGGFAKRFTPRPQRVEYELPPIDPTQPIRLNKFLANAGICSRREADEFIQAGEVQVNGEVVTELGSKITPADIVTFRNQEVGLENKVYVLLNKPKDCVTTSDDPQGRLTVMDIVRNACSERIYPVGRLDRNTTGVLLLTNDGDLASKLTHPKFIKKKIYHVWTDKDVTEEDMQRIADGIELDDGLIHADAVSYATETDRNQIGIEIHSGRNRIVRRIFEALGYHVVKLDRVYFAGLTKKNLPRGRWRFLTQAEVNMLMMGSFE